MCLVEFWGLQMGFMVECGFLVEDFLEFLVLDLISRKSFPHVKSTEKRLGCHAATATPRQSDQTFSGRASSRTVRVIPSILCRSLPTQSAEAEILDAPVPLSTRSAARKQFNLVRPSKFWQLKTCYNRTE
jgi:hypothetical protein